MGDGGIDGRGGGVRVKIVILGVGRMKNSPFERLWQDYAKRLVPPPALVEFDDRRVSKTQESLLAAIPPTSLCVALDERGESFSSLEFARLLQNWREQGRAAVSFIQGGADGLPPEVKTRADLLLSLGRMTLPHLLARLVLLEQLYRAQTISANHPYHRE
ncbi:MAG: 23S rRNA (pseudouridine(1915)-N(3))-methyltransferase RlmH [Alphaproteobacteria bacterium]|nr:23S rRNA (pseudouridine(1915)-N(3))-methyltransferase RlmH [Alphaproteobacteria bacterium]